MRYIITPFKGNEDHPDDWFEILDTMTDEYLPSEYDSYVAAERAVERLSIKGRLDPLPEHMNAEQYADLMLNYD